MVGVSLKGCMPFNGVTYALEYVTSHDYTSASNNPQTTARNKSSLYSETACIIDANAKNSSLNEILLSLTYILILGIPQRD